MSEAFTGPFLSGLLLGGALWQPVIGVTLVRRGHYTPPATWPGRHLRARPRIQGWGMVGMAVVFTLSGACWGLTPLLGFAPILAVAVLLSGLVVLLVLGARLEQRARDADLVAGRAEDSRPAPSPLHDP